MSHATRGTRPFVSVLRARRVTAAIVATALAVLGAGSVLPAAAVDTGTISGTVTGPGGAPLSEATVVARSVADRYTYTVETTAADGTYTIVGLASGFYRVDFSPPTGVNAVHEYWKDVTTYGGATPVEVLNGGAASGIDAQLAAGGTITGKVTGPGGTPLVGVHVYAIDGTNEESPYAITGADGTYAITRLPAGSIMVSFDPRGLNGLVGQMWQDAGPTTPPTRLAMLVGGMFTGIDAQLAVGGTISGKVTWPAGKPTGPIAVYAFPPIGGGSVAFAAADGTYAIHALYADSYRVEFYGGLPYAMEYWANAGLRSTSTPVVVALGATVPGIDAELDLAAAVSGTVRSPEGTAVDGVMVEVEDADGAVVQYGRTGNGGTGTGAYSFTGLRAGDVKVAFARASGTTPYVPQYFDGASSLAAASTVSLTSGATTTGIDATLATGASITGRVLAADGSPRAGVRMRALTLDRSLPTRGGVTGEDGRYVIEGLLPGDYVVAAASTSSTGGDTFYKAGTVVPSAPNVTVTGKATTRGVDIVTGVAEQPLFLDVFPSAPFFSDIQWLAGQGITRGSVQPDGSVFFDPAGAVRREAMAAFLYRFAGSPDFTPPAVSPFVDVATGDTFYKEIAWLADSGISTGTAMGDGTFQFRPAESVSREAMAAFLYRFEGRPDFTAPATSPFADVLTSATFYKEISWLAANHISTGTDLGDGTFAFRPTESVRREAMAAFLHRTSNLTR